MAAVALSGFLSVVAAQAFKGRAQAATPTPSSTDQTSPDQTSPDRIPPATDDAQPLQPPAQPPAAADPQPSAPAPAPQVSGGS